VDILVFQWRVDGAWRSSSADVFRATTIGGLRDLCALASKSLEHVPDSGGSAGRGVRTRRQNQHLVVLGARFVDVRELRYEKSELHGESSKTGETRGLRMASPVPAYTDRGDRRVGRSDAGLASGEAKNCARIGAGAASVARLRVGHCGFLLSLLSLSLRNMDALNPVPF
jgi:hypothetical protein